MGIIGRLVLVTGILSGAATWANAEQPAVCQNFGPQAPRDIGSHAGTNAVGFPLAPAAVHS